MSVELHHQDKFRGPNDRNGQEGRTASLCQISSKSLEPRRRRGDFSIFQTRQISWRSVKPLPKYRIFGRVVRAGRVNEKKVQDRTGKKSQYRYISSICGEAHTKSMYIKNCLVGDVLDVITCVKFQNEIFKG